MTEPTTKPKLRIGILSGTFDPVHSGHIALAEAAIQAAQLDVVYLCPEASPRRKTGVTHYAHRLAMIKLAAAPHQKLEALELPDKHFSVAQTIPRLRQHFPNDELFYICGSDMLAHMPMWKLIDGLFYTMRLLVALRGGQTLQDVHGQLAVLPESGRSGAIVFETPKPRVSGSDIRHQLHEGTVPPEVLPSTREYIAKNWLYSVSGLLMKS